MLVCVNWSVVSAKAYGDPAIEVVDDALKIKKIWNFWIEILNITSNCSVMNCLYKTLESSILCLKWRITFIWLDPGQVASSSRG